MPGTSTGTAPAVIMAAPSEPTFRRVPAQIAATIRGHWTIEDRPHWFRDQPAYR